MARSIREAIAKMTQLVCRKIVHINFRWSIIERVSIIREFFRFIWDKILVCSVGKHRIRYRRLIRGGSRSPTPEPIEGCLPTTSFDVYESTDEDLVTLKISLLGDCQTGKTSFMIKYVGDEQEEQRFLEMTGVNLMDKTLMVQGARISFSLWDVGGDRSSLGHVPIACKDAVAILFMFDLTSRCTLNSVVGWYSEARKWNQTAIPILIGTKFDDFVRLPPDLQWTIVTQARAYAKAMNATLFFSSATHNINVNKIFKFILAKLFNLPWKVERNLNIGEPIIDY
ncbi:septum-promoting GTP-binding protein 1 [Argentina anserina]|uniref:septum-promoting GTP-binding protein 1 n=1 Tax=Argentina anserina TaxID=57926 RepID=UPI00217670AA|nr:septum-promoting GTP-binding protein 1 [Potentilla anserina]